MGWYEYFVILVYVVDTLLLFTYGMHYYLISYLYYKKRGQGQKGRHRKEDPVYGIKELKGMGEPVVTVQIPIYNELYVSERVVRAVMELDYPKDKLEVQLLDDSTDATQDILRKLAEEYKKEGYNIKYIRREIRIDHKAGALREGLKESEGEYVAIFDCDFIPPKDFLIRALPMFKGNRKLGLVQTRWGHLNMEYSPLTRAQALGVDGHFLLEQTTRSDYALWLNFNGTAGIWRKECILDGGNWQGDTLTEDLDLSYRAQMRGWEFRFMPSVVCDAELPVDVRGYKTQQFRWAKGSLQTAVKLIGKIIKAKRFPLRKRLEGMVHLTYYLVHPLMLLNLLWMYPLIEVQQGYFNYTFGETWYPALVVLGMIFMFLGMLAPSFFFMYTQRELTGSWTRRLKWLPYLFLYGLGIAVHLSKAFLEVLLRKKSGFIRTPKYSISKSSDRWIGKKYTTNIDMVLLFEILFGCYGIYIGYKAIAVGLYISAFFPFLFSISFFYISFLTIYQSIRERIYYYYSEMKTWGGDRV